MMYTEAIKEIRKTVTGLCINCDPDCPVNRGVRGWRRLPHCYVGIQGRAKKNEMIAALSKSHPDLSDADATTLDTALAAFN